MRKEIKYDKDIKLNYQLLFAHNFEKTQLDFF